MSETTASIPTEPDGSAPGTGPRLSVRDLHVSFGLHRVLDACSLTVEPGEVVALLGHNGAGKTTLLRAIMGLVTPTRGDIVFGDLPFGGQRVAWRARQGMALVPDVSRGGTFAQLSVRDNLALAEDVGRGAGREVPDEFLRELFPPIYDKADQQVRELSGGQRQMVAIAIALKRRPSMLLLDEPSVGLAPLLVKEVMGGIRRVTRELGIGALLVEQNVTAAAGVADRLAVLKSGTIVKELRPAEVADPAQLWHYF